MVVTAAVLVAGAVVSIGVRHWRRHWSTTRHRRPSFPRFARAIVGNTRGAVAQVLGPPRIATFVRQNVVQLTTDYRDADVWYYPLPERAGRAGMAIHFDQHNASSVEVFNAPNNSE